MGLLFFVVFPILSVYIYGAITNGKFRSYERKLDGKKPDGSDVAGYAFAWPLLLLIGEFSSVKGLIYPTLHMWPRFREEWPAMKAEVLRTEERKAAIRKREARRKRELQLGEATLGDAKEQVKHERTMAVINRDVEGFQQQLVDDYPPEIGDDDHYDLDYSRIVNNPALAAKKIVKEETETEDGGEPEVFCTRHRHFVTMEKLQDPKNSCTDKDKPVNLGYK